jgi:TonB family protein
MLIYKRILIIPIVLFSLNSFAQKPATTPAKKTTTQTAKKSTASPVKKANKPAVEEKIYTKVQEMPEFPGGHKGIIEYFENKLKYPALAKEKKITGNVLVRFIIDTTGMVRKSWVVKGLGFGCDEEAMRIINSMPRWTPGKDSGKAVSIYLNLPVRFSLKSDVVSDQASFNQGMKLMQKGDYAESIKSFTEALTINPKNSKSLLYRGGVYYKLKDSDNACNDWGRATELGNKEAANLTKKHCKR